MRIAVNPTTGKIEFVKSFWDRTGSIISPHIGTDTLLAGSYSAMAASVYPLPDINTAFAAYGQKMRVHATNFELFPWGIGSAMVWTNSSFGAQTGLNFKRANGTYTTKTSVGNGNICNQYLVYGYHQTAADYIVGAEWRYTADAAISATGTAEMPMRAELYLCPDGATVRELAFAIGSDKLMEHYGEMNELWGGLRKKVGGTFFVATADKVVTNTVTETTLIGTGDGTLTIPANFFKVGKKLRFHASGIHSVTGAATLRFKIKLGSTIICDTTAINDVNNTDKVWIMDLDLVCKAIGVTASLSGHGVVTHYESATSTEHYVLTNQSATFDSTANQAVDFTVQWGTASASNTITCQDFSVEILN